MRANQWGCGRTYIMLYTILAGTSERIACIRKQEKMILRVGGMNGYHLHLLEDALDDVPIGNNLALEVDYT